MGALVVVGCAVAAAAFHGAGYGLSDPAMTQTGQIMYDAIPDKWNPLTSIDLKGLGGKIAALGSFFVGGVVVRSWVGEKDKAVVDAHRMKLTNVLSHRQLGDAKLVELLSAIPRPHSCLLSHLGREDLELFVKGDDVLRGGHPEEGPARSHPAPSVCLPGSQGHVGENHHATRCVASELEQWIQRDW